MTKHNTRLVEAIEKWYQIRRTMTKSDFQMLKEVCWKTEEAKNNK